jgi:hypothetical protein
MVRLESGARQPCWLPARVASDTTADPPGSGSEDKGLEEWSL